MKLDNAKDKQLNIEGKLNSQQIQNWRNILCNNLRPYPLIIPEEVFQKHRDKFQKDLSKKLQELND